MSELREFNDYRNKNVQDDLVSIWAGNHKDFKILTTLSFLYIEGESELCYRAVEDLRTGVIWAFRYWRGFISVAHRKDNYRKAHNRCGFFVLVNEKWQRMSDGCNSFINEELLSYRRANPQQFDTAR